MTQNSIQKQITRLEGPNLSTMFENNEVSPNHVVIWGKSPPYLQLDGPTSTLATPATLVRENYYSYSFSSPYLFAQPSRKSFINNFMFKYNNQIYQIKYISNISILIVHKYCVIM